MPQHTPVLVGTLTRVDGCRFRLDLARLREGDQPGAQAAKEALENRQRHDAKTRKEANPALH